MKSSDDAKPYKVEGHRHAPEIAQELHALGQANEVRPSPSSRT